jgi:mTERF domain-containing protein, mitochondrial
VALPLHPPTHFSIEGYLITVCGLTPAQARVVSKKAFHDSTKYGRTPDKLPYSRLNSASNPDAISRTALHPGLSHTDIAVVVSMGPLLLRASVKNIAPYLLGIHDLSVFLLPKSYASS